MCDYIFKKGMKKGLQCPIKPKKGTFCSKHNNKKINNKDFCTICMTNIYKSKSETKCKHTFHSKCLDKWLQSGNTCPLCRTELCEKKEFFCDDEEYSFEVDSFSESEDTIVDVPDYLRNISIKTDWDNSIKYTDELNNTTIILPKIILPDDFESDEEMEISEVINVGHDIPEGLLDMYIENLDRTSIDFLIQEGTEYDLPLQFVHHITYS